jgi:fatty acid desaturase
MKERSGLSLSTVVLVVFVILKLVGVIAWSWWWVLSPIWISAGLVLLWMFIFAIILLYSHWYGKNNKH